MATVSNMNELTKAIMTQMYVWMQKQQLLLPQYLSEFIRSEYYAKYTPSDLYDRKYRILQAIVSSDIVPIVNGYALKIYLDPTKVSYDPSIWTYPDGQTYAIPGDDVMTVWNNMANGIHGDESFGVTDGNFWETFLNAIGQGGVYDLYRDFKTFVGTKAGITVL